MSNKPIARAANWAVISRLRVDLLLFVALLSAIGVKAGCAQGPPVRGPVVGAPVPGAQHQSMDDTDGSGGDPDSSMAQRRLRMLNNERQKSIVSDSDKLLKLTTELNDEIAHSNPGTLTPDQLRKIAEIEKLAHDVRDKMTMTIGAPTPNYFAPYGPPFGQQ
jgi:hypothetical protein